MVRWRLKDKNLEEKFLNIYPDFNDELNIAINNDLTDEDGLFEVFCDPTYKWGFIVNPNIVEQVPEYDPKNWNKYHEVTPPVCNMDVYFQVEILTSGPSFSSPISKLTRYVGKVPQGSNVLYVETAEDGWKTATAIASKPCIRFKEWTM